MTPSALPPYTTTLQRAGHWALWLLCGAILVFLIAPVLVVIPLAFNNEPYFHFPIREYSLRWFADLFGNPVWLSAIANSLVTATLATLLATSLGTLAAVGLNHRDLPGKRLIMAVLIAPMIVPVVVLAVGAYFFFSRLGIANNLLGIVLVHAVLGMPFVLITVNATLAGFDMGLLRAARSLGASPIAAFRRVMLPIVWPGVLSGALFAFATSFDEVVVVLFLGGPGQTTLPRQMWSGLREQLSPTILAAAFVLIIFAIALLLTLEMLRRRSVALRGLSES
jgi:putative spermidine/putrescine transport system permease protein